MYEPDPEHNDGVDDTTDFGPGLYLSDDLEGSYIWGARYSYPTFGTLNVYDIDNSIRSLNGLILSDSYEDILTWAITTGFYLKYNSRGIASRNAGMLDDQYRIDTDNYDWILSRRTDDKMYSYIDSFLDGSMSFQGLVECYDKLAFGDELVLKTQRAIDCLILNEQESRVFDKSPYLGQYDQLKKIGNEEFDYRISRIHSWESDELGIEEIIELIEQGEDWTEYV